MTFFDFGSVHSKTYESKCDKCGKVIFVSTEKDDCAAYYTEVQVKCDCGGKAVFMLPVN